MPEHEPMSMHPHRREAHLCCSMLEVDAHHITLHHAV